MPASLAADSCPASRAISSALCAQRSASIGRPSASDTRAYSEATWALKTVDGSSCTSLSACETASFAS